MDGDGSSNHAAFALEGALFNGNWTYFGQLGYIDWVGGDDETLQSGVFGRGGFRYFQDDNSKFELSLAGHTGGDFQTGGDLVHWVQIASEYRHRFDGSPWSVFAAYQGDWTFLERVAPFSTCCDEEAWVHSLWLGAQLSFGLETLMAEDRYGAGTFDLPNFRAPLSYADELD